MPTSTWFFRIFISSLALLTLSACDGTSTEPDGGATPDAAGSADGGTTPDGSRAVDDGGPGSDAGTPGGPTPSGQIVAAREAVDGEVDLPIEGAIVTYVKPAVGDDAAGFFIQAERTGPALFVAVDPTSLSPTPAPGSAVSFRIDSMRTVSARREIAAISDFREDSTGFDLTPLIQDITNADNVLEHRYESELIRVSASIQSIWRPAGTDHVAAAIDTPGLATFMEYQIRLPADLRDELDIIQPCQVTLTGPMWRTDDLAQPTAYAAADVSVTSCPEPRVETAFATSSTTAVIRFDRAIDSASVTDASTQFVIEDADDTPLAVSAAVASGTEVTLTTATQTEGAAYTVTVADTVQNPDGQGVDPAANSASFAGYSEMAMLSLNELNATITSPTGCDLIELRVTRAGSIEGFALIDGNGDLVRFGAPGLTTVALDDLIVVHLNPAARACRGGADAPAISESSAKDEVSDATNDAYFDAAWDVFADGIPSNLSPTTVSLWLEDPTGTIVDAALFLQSGSSPNSAGLTGAETIRAAGQWTDPGSPYDATSYEANAVPFDAANDSAASPSVQRSSNEDTNAASDWETAASTWGTLNVGQTSL